MADTSPNSRIDLDVQRGKYQQHQKSCVEALYLRTPIRPGLTPCSGLPCLIAGRTYNMRGIRIGFADIFLGLPCLDRRRGQHRRLQIAG